MKLIKYILIFLAVLLGIFILKAVLIALGLFFIFVKYTIVAAIIALFMFIGYHGKQKNR
jgi:uncharacterized membrane protein